MESKLLQKGSFCFLQCSSARSVVFPYALCTMLLIRYSVAKTENKTTHTDRLSLFFLVKSSAKEGLIDF